MTYRNKTYVAFDADNDIHYYRLMQAWKKNDNTSFDFYDAHELNNLRQGSSEETIKQKLSERLKNAKLFILLIGDKTKHLYKFVRWEIEGAINRKIPIIAVNLNGNRGLDEILCPPILKDKLAIHVSFNQKIIEYAMDSWIDLDKNYRNKSEIGAYYYQLSIYEKHAL